MDIEKIHQDLLSIYSSIGPFTLVGSAALILHGVLRKGLNKKLDELIDQYLPLIDDYDIVIDSGRQFHIKRLKTLCNANFSKIGDKSINQLNNREIRNGVKMIRDDNTETCIKIDYMGINTTMNPSKKRPHDNSSHERAYPLPNGKVITLISLDKMPDYSSPIANNEKKQSKHTIKHTIYNILKEIVKNQENNHPAKKVKPSSHPGSPPLIPKKLFGGRRKMKKTKSKSKRKTKSKKQGAKSV